MSDFLAKRIVVPVDFSSDSLTAIDQALGIAESPSNVHVVHVIPELNVAEAGVIWQEIDNSTRSKHAMEKLHELLSEEKYGQLQFHVEIGDPGYRIADFAKQNGADLIVMPSHGRTGIAHMLLGSVAERVIRMSHCPVLVIKK